MQLAGRKILVTGGAGFIGSNLVDSLVLRGNQVIVLDDFSTGKRENLSEAEASGKVSVVQGSILDYPLVKSLMPGVSVVMHLAVQCLRMCFDRPDYVHDVNATGTLNVLRAAHAVCGAAGLERFVYVSSSEVYGTAVSVPMKETHELGPTTIYGASKLAGELYAQAYRITWGMPVVILRPFNTYGYREHHEGVSGEVIPRFLVRILNGQPPVIFGDGSQTRDFTFVTDTVEGIIAASCADSLVGQAVNIAFGQEVSIKAVAEKLLALLGRQDLAIEWAAHRPGDVHRHFADMTKLEFATGFKPAISIDHGLKLYVDWFRRRHPDPRRLLAECHKENWSVSDAEVCASTTH